MHRRGETHRQWLIDRPARMRVRLDAVMNRDKEQHQVNEYGNTDGNERAVSFRTQYIGTAAHPRRKHVARISIRCKGMLWQVNHFNIRISVATWIDAAAGKWFAGGRIV